MDQPVDLLVVGGGVNGTGIARDAVGRGLSVLLCEQDDLASHTSSASSKLIHGGLRYLEHYEFRLVREALIEREVLLRAAPHIIWPLRFVLPYSPEQRPAWMIRLGLFLYDHLGGRARLPGSGKIDLRDDPAGAPLKPEFRTAFSYADCWVDDARLVVLNAKDAAERGAEILCRRRCVEAKRANGLWHATLRPAGGGRERVVRARCLVNATGPWVSRFLTDNLRLPAVKRVRLVKGSHIVVRRLRDHRDPYILQNSDRRVVFVIPYEQQYSLIGTTDLDYADDPASVEVSGAEIDYLCRAVGRYFKDQPTPERVFWSYAGVRPLYDDASSDVSAVTRDYVVDLDRSGERPPAFGIRGQDHHLSQARRACARQAQVGARHRGRGLDRERAFAGRGSAARRLRGVPRRVEEHLSLASRRPRRALRAGLRDADRASSGWRGCLEGPGRASRRRPL